MMWCTGSNIRNKDIADADTWRNPVSAECPEVLSFKYPDQAIVLSMLWPGF